MPGPGHGRMQGGKRIENPGKVFKRLMRYVAASYGLHLILVAVLIFVSVLANVQIGRASCRARVSSPV